MIHSFYIQSIAFPSLTMHRFAILAVLSTFALSVPAAKLPSSEVLAKRQTGFVGLLLESCPKFNHRRPRPRCTNPNLMPASLRMAHVVGLTKTLTLLWLYIPMALIPAIIFVAL